MTMRDDLAKGRRLLARVRERLATRVKEAGLSQAGLERATGYRQSDISRFFTGQWVNPPIEFLDSLCRVFDLTLADLLREELPRPSLTARETDLLAQYRAMKQSERVALDAFLTALLRRAHGRDRE